MEKTERLYFLDNLKAFIILLVIILHAEICYASFPFPRWIQDKDTHLLFTFLMFITEQPLMTTMFFIAGYFTIPSLLKQGPILFIKKKFLRLGLPLIIGVVTIIPLTGYLSELSNGFKGGFFTFWTGYFTSEIFTHYHLWFLGTLLLFFILTVLINMGAKKFILDKEVETVKPSLLFMLAVPAVSTLLFTLTGKFTTLFEWTVTLIIQFQNVRLPIYIVYFIIGIYAYKRNWFQKEGYKPHPLPWTILFVISNLAYTYFIVVRYQGVFDTTGKVFAVAVSYSIASFSGLLMFLGIFQRFFNKSPGPVKSISAGSYPAYIIHLTILFLAAYLFIPLPIPLGLKFLTVTTLSIGITWILAIGMRKIPLVKKIL